MIGEPVTRQRGQQVTDVNGDTYIDWSLPTNDLVIDNCALAPRTEEEVHGAGRGGVVVGYTLYAPFGADIEFTDRIATQDYGLFELEGEPGQWRNPYTGNEWGSTMALRRVDG